MPSPAIRSAWNAACGSSWPTRSPATSWACGCLIPEHLRLGTWDLLCGWSGQPGGRVEPRLALQLVHESALCSTGLRQQRSLSQRGFELANGLPFVASDVADSLPAGRSTPWRRPNACKSPWDASAAPRAITPENCWPSTRIARPASASGKCAASARTRRSKPYKVAQTFFVLDPDTHQPVCFTTATSSRTATTAAIELLELAAEILAPQPKQILVLADMEHYTTELFNHVQLNTPFDLLVPMKNERSLRKQLCAIPPEQFTRRWAGFATTKQPYQMSRT